MKDGSEGTLKVIRSYLKILV